MSGYLMASSDVSPIPTIVESTQVSLPPINPYVPVLGPVCEGSRPETRLPGINELLNEGPSIRRSSTTSIESYTVPTPSSTSSPVLISHSISPLTFDKPSDYASQEEFKHIVGHASPPQPTMSTWSSYSSDSTAAPKCTSRRSRRRISPKSNDSVIQKRVDGYYITGRSTRASGTPPLILSPPDEAEYEYLSTEKSEAERLVNLDGSAAQKRLDAARKAYKAFNKKISERYARWALIWAYARKWQVMTAINPNIMEQGQPHPGIIGLNPLKSNNRDKDIESMGFVPLLCNKVDCLNLGSTMLEQVALRERAMVQFLSSKGFEGEAQQLARSLHEWGAEGYQPDFLGGFMQLRLDYEHGVSDE